MNVNLLHFKRKSVWRSLMILVLPAIFHTHSHAQMRTDHSNRSESHELVTKRTKYSKHFNNNDGTFAIQIGKKYHYRDDNGLWQNIDLSLTPYNKSGISYANMTNDFKSFFPENSNGGIKMILETGFDFSWWNNPKMSYNTGSVSNIHISAATVPPVMANSHTINFHNVFPSVTEQFVMLEDGIEHNTIFNSLPSEVTSLPGGSWIEFNQFIPFKLGWSLEIEGNKVFSDVTTKEFHINIPGSSGIYFGRIVTFDNTLNQDEALYIAHTPHEKLTASEKEKLNNNIYLIDYDISYAYNGIYLKSKLPADWLKSAGRAFPVTIDPTVTISPAGAVGDGYNTATNNHWGFQRHANLFLESEIGISNIFITDIEFNRTNTSGTNAVLPYKIFFRTTTSTTLSSAAWNSTTYTGGLSPSFDASIDLHGTTSGWKNFVLSDPFLYTGGNLIMMVHDAYGGSGSYKSMSRTSTGVTSRQAYSRSDTSDPGDGVSLSVESFLPEIKITYIFTEDCSGTPEGGTASATPGSGGTSSVFTLGSTGMTAALGIEYQWETSEDGESGWTDIAGATTISYSHTAPSVLGTTYYRLRVTCDESDETTYSTVTSYSVIPVFTMPVTGSETYTTCSGVFYDNGGPSGDYANSSNGTVTFYPSSPGGKVQITFTAFGTESCCDGIFIYDGNSMSAPILVDNHRGSTLPAGGATITSTAADGSLTLRFVSDGSVVGIGWAATLNCDLSGAVLCEGTPEGGTASATPGSGAISSSFLLSSADVTAAIGIDYQWETSEDGESGWTDIAGATTISYTHTAPAVLGTTYYRLRVTCTESDETTYSTVTSYSVVPVITMPVTGSETYTTCSGVFYDNGGPSGSYANSSNGTVTFYPSSPGGKVQITFTEFGTESCCDGIYVYDGNSTSATILVDNHRGTTLPAGGATITSSAADGSLTVRFVSDGSVVGIGWAATLNCDLSGAVPCEGIPEGGTASATPGSGDVSSAFLLSTVDVTAAIGIDYQWETSEDGESGWTDIAGATTISYTHTAPAVLGTTYYRLRVTCTESDETTYSTVTSYSVVPVITMPVTGTATHTTCEGVFYDNGGPSGSYANSSNGTVTFYPSYHGAKVQLTFTEFGTESCCDGIYVYDGNSTSAPLLVDNHRGTTLPAGGATITSTAADGSLTVRFVSDGSVVGIGWVASLNCDMSGVCFEPEDIAVSDVSASSATIAWDIIGSSIGVDIEYGPAGFTSGEGTLLTDIASPVVLSELVPNTLYDFIIINNCTEESSAPTVKHNFTTNCLTPGIVSSTIESVCLTGSAVIEVEPSEHGIVRWYADAALTELLGEETVFTSPVLTETTDYYATVEVGNEGGCISPTYTFAAMVYPKPELTVEPLLQYACPGTEVTFVATEADYIYAWSNGAATSAMSTDTEGIYTLVITDINGCKDTAEVAYIYYGTASVDGFDFIPTHHSDYKTVSFIPINAQEVSNYLWDFGDGHTSEDSEPIHTYADSGIYTVFLIVSNDCTIDTTYMDIYVRPDNTSTDDIALNSIFNIYPNPAGSDRVVTLELSATTEKMEKVTVYNILGREVFHRNIPLLSVFSIDVSSLPAGQYFIKIDSNNGLSGMKKLIIR